MSDSSNKSAVSYSSNKSTVSNSSNKSAMSNVTSRHNTDSPHPVGSNSMGGARVVSNSSDRGPESLGLGDSPVLALQRLVHRLVGDLTTSHCGNSHRVGNNSGANHRSSSHNTSMASSSNKSAMCNSSDKTATDKTS